MKGMSSIVVIAALIFAPILAQGGTKKKVIHSDITVTKKNESASPKLAQTPTNSPQPSATPTKKTAKKTVVSQGVLNGKAISKPPPAYPPIAK